MRNKLRSPIFFGAAALLLVPTSIAQENYSERSGLNAPFDYDSFQDRTEQIVRGVIMASQEAQVSVDLSARLTKVPYDIGDRFEQGAILVSYDCRRLRAEANAAKASQKSLALAHANARELFNNGAAGELELATAKADEQQAHAQWQARQVRVNDCDVKAPYSGYIVERYVDPFETPAPGDPLLKIIDDQPVEIHLIAPSSWLGWLKIDEPFNFTIDETGALHTAKIFRIGRAVDSASQTINLVARFIEDDKKIIAGMSGTADFSFEGN